MATLGTFVFKPKYDLHITKKILETFTQEWLQWTDAGAYIYWHEAKTGADALPQGYVKFDIDMDCGNLEEYSETCWHEDPVSAEHLTNDLFVLLIEAGFFDPGEYHFHERELTEVVTALSDRDSRLLTFWTDRCLAIDIGKDGKQATEVKNLSNLLLSDKTTL